MQPFEFKDAKPWTQIQYLWNKDYIQANPDFINLFKDDDNKLRYIENETMMKDRRSHKLTKVELRDEVHESTTAIL